MPILLAATLVTIRIYNYAGVPPAELAAARASAERILQEAGLSLQWRMCRVPSAAERAGSALNFNSDACTDVLRDAGEFVLRLQTSAHAGTSSHLALGDSLIDGSTGGGVLITIDPQLTRTIAAQASADPAMVLGRAMAHEVGHLLIGTPAHSPHGLMRALWTQRELRGNSADDWQFTDADIAQMKLTALTTRELEN